MSDLWSEMAEPPSGAKWTAAQMERYLDLCDLVEDRPLTEAESAELAALDKLRVGDDGKRIGNLVSESMQHALTKVVTLARLWGHKRLIEAIENDFAADNGEAIYRCPHCNTNET